MFHNTDVYSVFKNKRNNRDRSQNRLNYMDLEPRQLLAVSTVSVDPTTSVLLIRGSDTVDDQAFVSTAFANEVRVLLNGNFSVFPRSSVDTIRFEGNGGNDTFSNSSSDIPAFAFGGLGNDRLIGGSAADRLTGEDGDDILIGNAADDLLFGGQGQDTLQGSAGNDTLRGGDDSDSLRGDAGNDSILGEAGDDTIAGGDGNDILIGGVGNDTVFGQLGNDQINGGAGNDRLFGNQGNDILLAGIGDDEVFGQDGDDRVNGFQGTNTIIGGAGDDILRGGANDDTIRGGGGNDSIIGLGGDDVLSGDVGDDFIIGGEGADTIDGGADNDVIGGGDGDDTIDGSGGNNLVFGGDGDDLIRGGDQNDNLFGQSGDDTIFGFGGADRVIGNDGADSLDGGLGNDILVGNDGDDRLFGGVGDDDLRGGDGADGLFGGIGGSDRLFGDGGSDRFLIPDDDQIIGLESQDAEVEFRNTAFAQWTDAEINVIDDGLARLQSGVGNNRLAQDPLIDNPIVFVKERTLPAGISLSQSNVVEVVTSVFNPVTGLPEDEIELERQYVFADWDENDLAANELRRLEIPRTVSIAWASSEALSAVSPALAEVFNRFTQFSAWRTTPSGSFFRVSEDGNFFYRSDAEFADDTGRINPTQDWASVWELFFTPVDDTPAIVNTTDPFENADGAPVTLLPGPSVSFTSTLIDAGGGFVSLDNFGFTLDATATVSIFAGDPTNGVQDSTLDVDIAVFELNDDGTLGGLFAVDSDSGDGQDFSLDLTLDAGNYVAVVAPGPILIAEAREGLGFGPNGTFEITFEGVDGVAALVSGPLNMVAGPPPAATPDTFPQLSAKLAVLDGLFAAIGDL